MAFIEISVDDNGKMTKMKKQILDEFTLYGLRFCAHKSFYDPKRYSVSEFTTGFRADADTFINVDSAMRSVKRKIRAYGKQSALNALSQAKKIIHYAEKPRNKRKA